MTYSDSVNLASKSCSARRQFEFAFAFLTIAALAGCANFNSIYRETGDADVKIIAVDVKQRFAFKGMSADNAAIICPEASPDAMSSYAASANLSLEQLKAVQGLGLGFASAEDSKFVGLRTQSIQLLRDQLTHMCLLRMAGISTEDHKVLFKRYQAMTLGLLAIEQLTGPLRVESAGTSSSAATKPQAPATPASAGGAVVPVSISASGAGATAPASLPVTTLTDQRFTTAASSVVAIVAKVIDDGFGQEECYAAWSNEATRSELHKQGQAVLKCLERQIQQAERQDCDPLADPNVCVRSVAAQVGVPTETLVARKLISTNLLAQLSRSSPLTLETLDFDVFMCSEQRRSEANRLGETLGRQTQGRVRVREVPASRRPELNPPNVISVRYDMANTTEAKAVQAVRTIVQQVFPNEAVAVEPNTGKPTPFYISVWVCP